MPILSLEMLHACAWTAKMHQAKNRCSFLEWYVRKNLTYHKTKRKTCNGGTLPPARYMLQALTGRASVNSEGSCDVGAPFFEMLKFINEGSISKTSQSRALFSRPRCSTQIRTAQNSRVTMRGHQVQAILLLRLGRAEARSILLRTCRCRRVRPSGSTRPLPYRRCCRCSPYKLTTILTGGATPWTTFSIVSTDFLVSRQHRERNTFHKAEMICI